MLNSIQEGIGNLFKKTKFSFTKGALLSKFFFIVSAGV
jgi:hypothetical protein